jgi:signal transduction histidine kinase
MKNKRRTLLPPYQKALGRYLKQEPSASLKPAEKLGHEAIALDLETLDLALIHEQAILEEALPVTSTTARNQLIMRARLFFAEAILPMEESHRNAVEANAELNEKNEALNQKTLDLAASNRKLKKEIAKRLLAEQSLRESEIHTRRLLEKSTRQQKEMCQLSHKILSTQEDERKRISRELHDVVAQMLTGINIQLATLKTEAQTNSQGFSKDITRAQKLVEKSVDKVHRFARELRPAMLDDLGLIAALQSIAKGYSNETGIRINLTVFAGVEKLTNTKRTVLFRVAQEALSNVVRHADATRVDLRIEEVSKAVRMQITDDGKSFDLEKMWHSGKSNRLGVLGMRERVEMVRGTFAIESEPGEGTSIHVQIPYNNASKGQPRL